MWSNITYIKSNMTTGRHLENGYDVITSRMVQFDKILYIDAE